MNIGKLSSSDGTARVTNEKKPVLFTGVVDMNQSFHLVSAAVVNSENMPQIFRALKATHKCVDVVRTALGKPPVQAPTYGCADNSDAIQGAYEGIGTKPINCRIHLHRGVGKAEICASDRENRKETVSAIKNNMHRADTAATQSAGAVQPNPIAAKVIDLFVEKCEIEGQVAFAQNYRKEAMGERKGLHQNALMGPGLPAHTNSLERFNCGFKDDGAYSSIDFNLNSSLLPMSILNKNSIVIFSLGTLWTQPNIQNFVPMMTKFLGSLSMQDSTFAMVPTIALNDWRHAQIFLEGEQLSFASKLSVGGRDIIIVPSTQTLSHARTTADPKEAVKDQIKKYLKVYKKGLVRGALGEDPSVVGFDAVMNLLESCYVLFELDGGGKAEIKFQCSCTQFWHYYKCKHSLGLSIREKGISIPAIYNITNISKKARPGRPKKARQGGALERA